MFSITNIIKIKNGLNCQIKDINSEKFFKYTAQKLNLLNYNAGGKYNTFIVEVMLTELSLYDILELEHFILNNVEKISEGVLFKYDDEIHYNPKNNQNSEMIDYSLEDCSLSSYYEYGSEVLIDCIYYALYGDFIKPVL